MQARISLADWYLGVPCGSPRDQRGVSVWGLGCVRVYHDPPCTLEGYLGYEKGTWRI